MDCRAKPGNDRKGGTPLTPRGFTQGHGSIPMKLGIVGEGNVGCACALTEVNRGTASEIRYGLSLSPRATIAVCDYADLAGKNNNKNTSGVNEKSGGATDRNDKE